MRKILFILLLISVAWTQVIQYGVHHEDVNSSARQSITLRGVGCDVGDLMIVVITKDDDHVVAEKTTSDWIEMTSSTSGTGNAFYTAYRVFESGDIEWDWESPDDTNEDWAGWLLRFSGNDTTNPIHASEDSVATSDAPEAPDVAYTNLTAGSIVIRAFGADDDDTPYTMPADAFEIFNNDAGDTGGAGGIELVVVDQNTSSSGSIAFSATKTGMAQSFTGNGKDLTQAKWFLDQVNSPTGDIVCKLYSHTGTYGTSSEPNALLATSETLSLADMPDPAGVQAFNFPTPYTLANGVYYCIALETSDCDGTDYLSVYRRTTTSHDGNAADYDSGSWSPSSTEDKRFYVMSSNISGTDNTGTSVFGMGGSEQWVAATIIIEAEAGAPPSRSRVHVIQ